MHLLNCKAESLTINDVRIFFRKVCVYSMFIKQLIKKNPAQISMESDQLYL